MSSLPQLNRLDSDTSEWTDAEKEAVKHLDQSRVPQTIAEEDEGGNVGLAAYERSKELGEIVSLYAGTVHAANNPDARAEQENSTTNRYVPTPSLPHHADFAVPRQNCPELCQSFRYGEGYGHVW